MSEDAQVNLWGRAIGAVSLDPGEDAAIFQFDPAFAKSGIEVAPLTMPLRAEPYVFPDLPYRSFKGLPGLLSDSLPDRWGNALIDTWLARQGRTAESANAVERLCYTGMRGMGALEFTPVKGPNPSPEADIQISELVELASEILDQRQDFVASLAPGKEEDGLREILSVGMSAGGARAKAVIAWNAETGQVRSGQVAADPGFEHWLLKFDGVSDRSRESFSAPEGYGAIEYAYSEMARAAGVTMANCRLFEENGRRHFMTRRFDRPGPSSKLHMQSLAAMRHFDFNLAGGYSYEQALMTIRRLGLSMDAVEEQFRRMAFNVVARNQDDHVKNIAFLMDRSGSWSLSPAFDVSFAYAPDGDWTAQHQMSLNGKRADFVLGDFERCAEVASMKRGRAAAILAEVCEAVGEWERFAADARVVEANVERIGRTHLLELRPR